MMECNILLPMIGCMILSASGSELIDRSSDVSAKTLRNSETSGPNDVTVNDRSTNGDKVTAELFKREQPLEYYDYYDYDEYSALPEKPTSMRLRPFLTSIVVFWSSPKADSGITGYVIGYGDGIPDIHSVVVGKDKTSYSIRNLQPSTEYIISLRAFSQYGEGEPAYATGSTKEFNLPIGIPKPPVGIKAHATSPTTIVVAWDYPYPPVEDSVYSFQVRYIILGTQEAKELTTANHLVNLQDLSSSTTYEIKVRAGHNRTPHLSAWSISVTCRTPN